MASIWSSSNVAPTGTGRIPKDVSSSGAPSHVTEQQLADLDVTVGKTVQALGSINTNTTITISNGGYVTATIAGSLTFTFSGAPTGGVVWNLVLTNGGSATITWPGSVSWTGGTAPTLRTSGVDILRFHSADGGTTWVGELAYDEQDIDVDNATAGTLALARGGTGASLTDPNADRILFWDDSAGTMTWLTLGTGLSITDTTIAVSGGGTKTLAVFTPGDNQPPASSFATLDTRNSALVLDFDAAADESAIFAGNIPEAAVLTSGIVARIKWMATSATTGNVRWRVAFERGTTDLDADSFDTATEATGAANGTSGIETTTEITCTNIDSLVAGDRYRVRVTRVGTDGANDTMSGDAELVTLELRAA